MKKIILLLIVLIGFGTATIAQDIIITKDGTKIHSTVTEINENDIRYKLFENLSGPTYFMKKTEIASILYENGNVDVFNLDLNTAPAQQIMPNNTNYYTKADYERAMQLRNAGIICFASGIAAGGIGSFLAVMGVFSLNTGTMVVGAILMYACIPTTIVGIVMWPIGQTRMNKINRLNPNGFSLFENEKVQLNLAVGGNSMGLRLNF
jgi:hypothetical protein